MQEVNELRQFFLDTFSYKDGHLYWKEIKNGRKSDSPAGHINGRGYRIISIWNKKTKVYKMYSLHRIIFLMHHGYLPEVIDHIDGKRDNNNITNLRAVTQSENLFNSKLNTRNKTGCKGVKWSKQKQKFIGIVHSNRKEYYAGAYNTIEDATKATMELRNKLHGVFAKHN